MSEIFEHRHRKSRGQAEYKQRPPGWPAFRAQIRYRWVIPFLFIEWLSQWAAFALSKISFLELLEYCGSFSILIAVIFYFVDAPERKKTKHYQAWQVINTAQGKGGSGGRTDALRELNEDHVPLVGVDVSSAFLQGVELENADLHRGKFDASDMRNADLQNADLSYASMISANLRQADLSSVDFQQTDLSDADLTNADLRHANLGGTNLQRADMRGSNFADIREWKSIQNIKLANIHDIRNAPEGFVAWAISQGAVDAASDDTWQALLNPPGQIQPVSRP